jgi:hypothetical protein
MPAAPYVAFPGFAFNQAINSFKSCAGVVFFATIRCGLLANKAMGSKSTFGCQQKVPVLTGMVPRRGRSRSQTLSQGIVTISKTRALLGFSWVCGGPRASSKP